MSTNIVVPLPLDFESVTKLPNSHAWTLVTTDSDPAATPDTVPVVDLLCPNAASLVRHACETCGYVQVTNHGVPSDLISQAELQTGRLFSLPTQQKLRTVRSPNGLTGYGLARISPFFSKRMWSEGFTIAAGSQAEHARQLWPHDDDDHDHRDSFCNVMEMYQRGMMRLAEKMAGLMLGSLGITAAHEDIKWVKPKNGCSNNPQGVLQLNSYPVCPDPTKAMGLAPHSDSSLLTILHQSNGIGGLQVKEEGIGWVPVHPVNGALVVFVGDLMHILSNGRFNNVLHRAVVNETHHRVSLAYFYGPPMDVKISPLIDNHDHPPLYRPVTWQEYLDFKATHFNEALELIKNDVKVM
ncbi:Gibberellin-3 oxidase [Trema orientale]|uniref:gibberellin 3beta-dioxygenase n=1 Tax=Trema orientale TaxID=63057 RepID=A0A2P5EF66_TREOI|nr:Gibberellin-3 oxidase [Trema orientale]